MPTTTTGCPECEAKVELDHDVMVGEIVECAECGVELEVMKDGESFVLKPAPEEEEDWGE